MDILNFISWIKAGNYRSTLPTDVPNLLAIGSKDPSRDDAWLPIAVDAAPLQSLYNTGTVTQITSSTTQVTLNKYSGKIKTVSLTTAAGSTNTFQFYNNILTTNSILLLSLEYSGAATGSPIVRSDISAGVAKILITNTHPTAALNNVVTIHFMIINPQ
jgi:hypothetical protein